MSREMEQEYSEEFLASVHEREEWSVDRWREETSTWGEKQRILFGTMVLTANPEKKRERAWTNYDAYKGLEEIDLSSISEEDREIMQEMLDQYSFLMVYCQLSDGALARVQASIPSSF